MAKEHSHHYYFAGSGCKAGTMICAKCQKYVDTMKHDWVSSVKPLKYDDWGYRSRHRHCVDDQSGWEKIEKAKEELTIKINETVALLKTIDENILIAALETMELFETT